MSITNEDSCVAVQADTGGTLFEMQKICEDTVRFNILQYMPGYKEPFKRWLHEMLGSEMLRRTPCYMVIDMSRIERLSFLSYEDYYALTRYVSNDRQLKRLGVIFVMPPEERGYCMYKELIASDWRDHADVHRTTTVQDALEWISARKIGNR